MRKYTKGQEAFIQQRAQQLLVSWCEQALIGDEDSIYIEDSPYVEYAKSRKTPWVSEKSPMRYRVLSSGFSAAASFLKR